MPDVLCFVEDPGAANFLQPMMSALGDARVLAAGHAASYLAERGLQTGRPDADAADLLAREKPRALVIGTSENEDTLGLALVDAARSAGIPSVGLVDSYTNAAGRFRGRSESPLAHAPDLVLVPDEWTRAAFEALGLPAARIEVCGHPLYDRVLDKRDELEQVGRSSLRKKYFDAAGDRPVLLFVAEISGGLDAQQYQRSAEYRLNGRGHSESRTAIVLEELLDAASAVSEPPFFVLRLHPKNAPDEFSAYEREIDFLSRGEPPHELAFAADAVVGMSTSLLVEAALLGVPTLSVVPREVEREWLPTIRNGVTSCVTTRAALRVALPKLLATPRSPQAPKWAARGAAARAAAAVNRLIRARE